MKTAGRVRVLMATVLAVVLGAWATGLPVAAQSSGTVHISVRAGERQGEYEVPDPFCSAGDSGPGSWYVSGSPTPEVAQVSVTVGTGYDTIFVDLGNYEYSLYAEEADIRDFQVDDRGSSATLTIRAGMTSPDETEAIPVEIVAECTVLYRSRDMPWPSGVPSPGPPTAGPTVAIPTLAPVQLGSPAPGSSTFQLVLDSGPDAGSFDVWTLSNACRRLGETGWVIQYTDAATTPSSVSLLLLADASSTVGTVTLGFGAGPDARIYTAVAPTITIDDGGEAQTIQASGVAEGSGDAAPIGFQLSIGCAVVGP